MKKTIATLRDAPAASVEVPEELERLTHGALRLFPGVPKALSEDELAFIRKSDPALHARLDLREYVESKRTDRRGCTEAELETLARAAGVSHLPQAAQLDHLRAAGKLRVPEAPKRTPAPPRKAPAATEPTEKPKPKRK